MSEDEIYNAAHNLWAVLYRAYVEFGTSSAPDRNRLKILLGRDRLLKAVGDSQAVAEAMRIRGIGDLAQQSEVRHLIGYVADYIEPQVILGRPLRVDPALVCEKLAQYGDIRLLFDALIGATAVEGSERPSESPAEDWTVMALALHLDITDKQVRKRCRDKASPCQNAYKPPGSRAWRVPAADFKPGS